MHSLVYLDQNGVTICVLDFPLLCVEMQFLVATDRMSAAQSRVLGYIARRWVTFCFWVYTLHSRVKVQQLTCGSNRAMDHSESGADASSSRNEPSGAASSGEHIERGQRGSSAAHVNACQKPVSALQDAPSTHAFALQV